LLDEEEATCFNELISLIGNKTQNNKSAIRNIQNIETDPSSQSKNLKLRILHAVQRRIGRSILPKSLGAIQEEETSFSQQPGSLLQLYRIKQDSGITQPNIQKKIFLPSIKSSIQQKGQTHNRNEELSPKKATLTALSLSKPGTLTEVKGVLDELLYQKQRPNMQDIKKVGFNLGNTNFQRDPLSPKKGPVIARHSKHPSLCSLDTQESFHLKNESETSLGEFVVKNKLYAQGMTPSSSTASTISHNRFSDFSSSPHPYNKRASSLELPIRNKPCFQTEGSDFLLKKIFSTKSLQNQTQNKQKVFEFLGEVRRPFNF